MVTWTTTEYQQIRLLIWREISIRQLKKNYWRKLVH